MKTKIIVGKKRYKNTNECIMIFGISEKLERKYGKYREWLQEQIIKIRSKKTVETFIK